MARQRRSRRPAMTPEARENQMIALAINTVEERIENGTASAQELTHYLKLGSTREILEQERLRNENEMLRAKVESLKSARRVEELMDEALHMFRRYAGHEVEEQEYDEYYDD